jgi:hypothetical protein
MELIQQLAAAFLQVFEGICDLREGQIGAREFEERVWDIIMGLGQDVEQIALEEQDKYLLEHPEKRQGWSVQRGPEEKTIMSLFGPVTYQRRYYYNKETKEHLHLVDALAGISPHQWQTPALQARHIAHATHESYTQAARDCGNLVTRQTVGNTIKKIPIDSGLPVKEAATKRRVETLYIEADEDHVALQRRKDGKKSLQAPLIYVHEGKGKRGELLNRFYLTGQEEADELWLKVLDYIDEHYDLKAIKKIFLSGDGAAWIRTGLSIIPGSIFVLDRFHLKKYATAAINKKTHPELFSELWQALQDCDRKEVKKILEAAEKVAESENRRRAVQKCRTYVQHNWDGIASYKNYREEIVGCSAEPHVSHVLSARMSSRPMAWSIVGAGRMAQLRVMEANGFSVREHYATLLSSRERGKLSCAPETIRAQRTLAAKYFDRLQAHLPALDGSRNSLTMVLKSLAFPA